MFEVEVSSSECSYLQNVTVQNKPKDSIEAVISIKLHGGQRHFS